MNNIPVKILLAFEDLKSHGQGRFSLKIINGKYYVYKESSTYDKELKRSKSLSEYLGRITEKGKFIDKKRKYETKPSKLEEEVRALGGRVLWGSSKTAKDAKADADINSLTEIDKKILTCLSMNARMPFSDLAKLTGLTTQAAYARAKKLEKMLKLEYVHGVSTIDMGYLAFIIFVTFEREIPGMDELKQIFASEPRITFAAIVQGKEYDLFAGMLVESTVEANAVISKLRTNTALSGYNSAWNITPHMHYFGLIQKPDEFYDQVLMGRVWKRTADSPKPASGQILYREYAVLKELNRNGIVDFTSIDARYNLPRGTARYTTIELGKRQWLTNPSIDIKGMPIKYHVLFRFEYENMDAFKRTKSKLIEHLKGYNYLTNRYSFVGEIGSPNSLIAVMPVATDSDFYDEVEFIRDNIQGIKVKTYVLTNFIIGGMANRRYDSKYAWSPSFEEYSSDVTKINSDTLDISLKYSIGEHR